MGEGGRGDWGSGMIRHQVGQRGKGGGKTSWRRGRLASGGLVEEGEREDLGKERWVVHRDVMLLDKSE